MIQAARIIGTRIIGGKISYNWFNRGRYFLMSQSDFLQVIRLIIEFIGIIFFMDLYIYFYCIIYLNKAIKFIYIRAVSYINFALINKDSLNSISVIDAIKSTLNIRTFVYTFLLVLVIRNFVVYPYIQQFYSSIISDSHMLVCTLTLIYILFNICITLGIFNKYIFVRCIVIRFIIVPIVILLMYLMLGDLYYELFCLPIPSLSNMYLLMSSNEDPSDSGYHNSSPGPDFRWGRNSPRGNHVFAPFFAESDDLPPVPGRPAMDLVYSRIHAGTTYLDDSGNTRTVNSNSWFIYDQIHPIENRLRGLQFESAARFRSLGDGRVFSGQLVPDQAGQPVNWHNEIDRESESRGFFAGLGWVMAQREANTDIRTMGCRVEYGTHLPGIILARAETAFTHPDNR